MSMLPWLITATSSGAAAALALGYRMTARDLRRAEAELHEWQQGKRVSALVNGGPAAVTLEVVSGHGS